MKLTDLSPRISPPGGAYQEIAFLCPRCRKHEIMIAIHHGPHGDVEVPLNGLPAGQEMRAVKRLWHAEQDEHKGWDSLSVTPSIDRTGRDPMDPCGGWHGFITNGDAA
jgi:hypothetical protein